MFRGAKDCYKWHWCGYSILRDSAYEREGYIITISDDSGVIYVVGLIVLGVRG